MSSPTTHPNPSLTGSPLTVSSLMRTIWSSLIALTVGNAICFRFYVQSTVLLFQHLPKALSDTNAMNEIISKQKPKSLELVLSQNVLDQYNKDMADISAQLKLLWGHQVAPVPFAMKQIFFWLIRIATCTMAWYTGSVKLVVLVSLLQFLCLPYSFFVAIVYGLKIVYVLYSGPLLVFPLLTWLVDAVVPAQCSFKVTISPWFLVGFLLADQLACAACLFDIQTPNGKPAPISRKRLLQSIGYGFLNCKTYFLILLPLCFGVEIPVTAWFLDAVLGLSARVNRETQKHWQLLFYQIHRMGHLVHVYNDAHRFHHHLPDSTAFDAHIFGSGAPEEWLVLLTDVLVATQFGLLPPCLHPAVLVMSWYDKWGLHTRSETTPMTHHESNFHVDHHLLHHVNYGISYPFEMIMGTAPTTVLAGRQTNQGNTLNGDSTKFPSSLPPPVTWEGYTIERFVDDDDVNGSDGNGDNDDRNPTIRLQLTRVSTT